MSVDTRSLVCRYISQGVCRLIFLLVHRYFTDTLEGLAKLDASLDELGGGLFSEKVTRLNCSPGFSDFDLEPFSLPFFFFSFSNQGSLQKTGLDKAHAFCSTRSEISSIETSVPSVLMM